MLAIPKAIIARDFGTDMAGGLGGAIWASLQMALVPKAHSETVVKQRLWCDHNW